MKHIRARTTGNIKSQNLRPEKSPDCDTTRIAYSLDMKEVLIRCYDDSINAAEYGIELTETEARTLFERWQNEWDTKCPCECRVQDQATLAEIAHHPCLANVCAGVSHITIDESRPDVTVEYDVWKTSFDGKPNTAFNEEARNNVIRRKQDNIIELASKLGSDPLIVEADIQQLTASQEEIDQEILIIRASTVQSAKERLIKRPLKTHKVPFK